MTKADAKKRIEKLRVEIDHHRYLYHALDRQEISDAALDSLKHELEMLEAQFPELITPNSPTQRVGGRALGKFEKIRHGVPMLSLTDAFSPEEMKEWEERNAKLLSPIMRPLLGDYYVELKIDGLAISLVYKNGFFVEGSTRGDGKIGENVTQNLKTVEAIPLKLGEKQDVISELRRMKLFHISRFLEKHWPETLEVRGEVFMPKKAFSALNRERKERGEEPYANPRNVAAGSVRQLDPRITASRHLDSFAYALITNMGQKTHEEEHFILKALGFKTGPHNKRLGFLKEIEQFHGHVKKIREKLDYEIDGIVVLVNRNEVLLRLGVVGKTPRGGIAYKFVSREATTVVEDIVVQVGRTGALTPVAHLRPVDVGGVTVSRATLHNEDEIQRLDVRIGDTVIVGRAGDVIPDVKVVLTRMRTGKERLFHMPKVCPVCLSRVVRGHDEAIHRCSNPRCAAQEREKLYHFVSRAAFDIVGMGPKIIDQLLEQNLVADRQDIFTLTIGDLLPLERFAETSAKKLIAAIEVKKRIPLHRFLYALGIRHVGEETSIELANAFGSIEALQDASYEKLLELHEVGEVMARSIVAWFKNTRNRSVIRELKKAGVVIENSVTHRAGGKLSGKTFVLTGSLGTMTRDEAKEKIRQAGGNISESVSKSTSYIVSGADPGSKYEKARTLGVSILTEQEFLKLLNK